MRYYYTPPTEYKATKARIYICPNHPLYNACTLYKFADRGMAVVQQRFNPSLKTTEWSSIDPWLVDDIFNQSGFMQVFDKIAKADTDGVYPTITVRKLMWALRMKPLPREFWESDPE